MSKKEKVLDILKGLHSNSDKTINAFMALCAFTFTAGGGVIEVPNWLIIISAIAMVVCAVIFVYFQRKIRKFQDDLGEL